MANDANDYSVLDSDINDMPGAARKVIDYQMIRMWKKPPKNRSHRSNSVFYKSLWGAGHDPKFSSPAVNELDADLLKKEFLFCCTRAKQLKKKQFEKMKKEHQR